MVRMVVAYLYLLVSIVAPPSSTPGLEKEEWDTEERGIWTGEEWEEHRLSLGRGHSI